MIHHSDQGSQYTSFAFGKRCREAGVRPSMGSVGDCYDNAMCESFFATLECELLDRRPCAVEIKRSLDPHPGYAVSPPALISSLPSAASFACFWAIDASARTELFVRGFGC